MLRSQSRGPSYLHLDKQPCRPTNDQTLHIVDVLLRMFSSPGSQISKCNNPETGLPQSLFWTGRRRGRSYVKAQKWAPTTPRTWATRPPGCAFCFRRQEGNKPLNRLHDGEGSDFRFGGMGVTGWSSKTWGYLFFGGCLTRTIECLGIDGTGSWNAFRFLFYKTFLTIIRCRLKDVYEVFFWLSLMKD